LAGLAIGAAGVAALASGRSGSTTTEPTGDGAHVEWTAVSRPPSWASTRGSAKAVCAGRSEANFPGGFTSSRNLVLGPLVLIGGAYTDPLTVREFGGNKFPLLVKAGHTVTLHIVGGARRSAGLAYGPMPQGETTLGDTHQAVTFVACRPGRPGRRYRENGPSGSYADGVSVTFWAGFVLTRKPACVPLEVYVHRQRALGRVGLSLGRRCDP
jgi:hypothetical protein